MNLSKMSSGMKKDILNAARKRNHMFARWIDLCSNIAFLMLAVIALINATELEKFVFGDDETVSNVVTVATVIISICFDFIFKSDKYKENVFRINNVLSVSIDEKMFDEAFAQNVELFNEIDVARARYDNCRNLKVHNSLSTQKDADKLQPVDIITINRERIIIVVLILEILLFVGLLVFWHLYTYVAYIILIVMVLLGVIAMRIDIKNEKTADKKVLEFYK